jgi:predicted aspartyl protease
MGRFSVDVELANFADMALARAGHVDEQDVRRVRVRGVVDSGAAALVIPEDVAKQLGLTVESDKTRVRYADGRSGIRKTVLGVHLTCQGRSGVFSAIVERGRDSALIGAIVLEDLDLIVDCRKQEPVPRDPKYRLSEIE